MYFIKLFFKTSRQRPIWPLAGQNFSFACGICQGAELICPSWSIIFLLSEKMWKQHEIYSCPRRLQKPQWSGFETKFHLSAHHLKLQLELFRCHLHHRQNWTTYPHKCHKEISLPHSFSAQTPNTSMTRGQIMHRLTLQICPRLAKEELHSRVATEANWAGPTKTGWQVARSKLVQDFYSHHW